MLVCAFRQEKKKKEKKGKEGRKGARKKVEAKSRRGGRKKKVIGDALVSEQSYSSNGSFIVLRSRKPATKLIGRSDIDD